jgi:CheY-like chemotaxis protein
MTAFNILLVEDNEGDVMIVERALDGWRDGCHLAVVSDGMQALDHLRRQGEFAGAAKPDLILLDINMPRMNGKECLKKLKQDEELKLIPVIMLTSSQAPSDIIDCYKYQASSYVLKPFNARAYVDAVRQVVTFWWDLAQRPSRAAW